MASRVLPPRPSLVQYKKQAKDLLKAANSGMGDAITRIDSQNFGNVTLANNVDVARFTLSGAQFAIAREHGFANWAKFVKHIESLTGAADKNATWRAAEAAVISGDDAALGKLLSANEQMFREEQPPEFRYRGLKPNYSAGEPRAILVQNHEFENWAQFETYREARRHSGTMIALFEDAADAIANGDEAAVNELLRQSPEIIHARSTRKHHSTLLHYVGANGIEYYRQRSPKNIVAIAKTLLLAGADVNAVADMYGGGSTTLGLTATSIHPIRSGVLRPLMELLLNSGAEITGTGAVNGCLANGRKAGAEWLADHGAPLDLEGAAGVGRLDLVKSFFAADGSFKNGANSEQMNRGFAWACEYGHTKVAEFLLDMGMDIGAPIRNHGQTGLHWAAHCAHIATSKALLKRGAEIDAKDATWGATPLSWALHGFSDPPPGTPIRRYYSIVKLLVSAGAAVDPAWLDRESVKDDVQIVAALKAEAKFNS